MSIGNVKVNPAEIGGGFGGKTTIYIEPLATALSRKCGRPVKIVMPRVERILIERALEKTGGNRTKASTLLGISHRALLYKLKEHGIQ